LFDEFKDFKHDLKYYPTRPIPRGLLSFQELTIIICIILFFEIVIGMSKGTQTLACFLITLIYSLLMLEEFFVRDWLRRHFTIYIISHEILLFPLLIYIYNLNGLALDSVNQLYFWILTFFFGSQLFLLEVVRKTRPKKLEIPSRDTYTAQYGIKRTSLLLGFLGLIAITTGILIEKVLHNNISVAGYFLLVILFYFLYSVLRFTRYPNKVNARTLFNTSILFVLLVNLFFIVDIIIFL